MPQWLFYGRTQIRDLESDLHASEWRSTMRTRMLPCQYPLPATGTALPLAASGRHITRHTPFTASRSRKVSVRKQPNQVGINTVCDTVINVTKFKQHTVNASTASAEGQSQQCRQNHRCKQQHPCRSHPMSLVKVQALKPRFERPAPCSCGPPARNSQSAAILARFTRLTAVAVEQQSARPLIPPATAAKPSSMLTTGKAAASLLLRALQNPCCCCLCPCWHPWPCRCRSPRCCEARLAAEAARATTEAAAAMIGAAT